MNDDMRTYEKSNEMGPSRMMIQQNEKKLNPPISINKLNIKNSNLNRFGEYLK